MYNGQFRVVPPEIVLADIDAQVAAGAQHISFGDPDFFNGPGHAMRIVEAMHASHPQVTFDVTIGQPGHEICEYADETNADMIVISSHGYHGMKRFLLGSVAEVVIRHAHVPVLVLRRADAE